MTEEWTLNLVLVVLGAILGSFVGFWFGLKATRKAQINDAKYRIYEKIYPNIESANAVLNHLITVQQIDISKLEDKEDVFKLLSEFGIVYFYLERLELLDNTLNDYCEDYEGDVDSIDELYEAMGDKWIDYFKEIGDNAIIILFNEFSHILKKLAKYDSLIDLAEPSNEVKEALEEVQNMIVGDYIGISLRGVFEISGLGKVIPSIDMAERGKVYKGKFDTLKKAMKKDLERGNKIL